MSTRSGKRLHSSFHENALKSDAERVHKTERMTRNKIIKENGTELDTTLPKSKLRTNYVSYPTDDELVGHPAVTDLSKVKNSRKLHRNTLKDFNAASEGITEDSGPKKVFRQTRSNKKLPDKLDDVIENAENIANGKSKIKKRKKKKSKSIEPQEDSDTDVDATTVHASKSRKKRKGKRSNSIVVEDIPPVETNMGILKTAGSEDSFHSAAGSPLRDSDNGMVKKLKDSDNEMVNTGPNLTASRKQSISNFNATLERSSHTEPGIQTVFHHTEEPTVLNGTYDQLPKNSSNRKLSLKNLTTDEVAGSLSNHCIPEKHVDNPENNNAWFEKDHDLRKSVSAIPLKETTEILNNTYEKVSNNDSKLSNNSTDTLNGTFKKQHRKSISAISQPATPEIRNSTYEMTSKNNSKLDSTYDKEMETNQLNNTLNKLSRKTSLSSRKSISAVSKPATPEIRNSTYEMTSKNNSKLDSTYDKEIETDQLNNTVNKLSRKTSLRSRKSISAVSKPATPEIRNSTYEMTSKNNSKLDSTYDKEMEANQLNNTLSNSSRKPSLSSSNTINVTLYKSNDNSQINISSDDSKTENIVNTTPVLIESSMDASHLSEAFDRSSANQTDPIKNTNNSFPNSTSLIREGTFTKDSPDIISLKPSSEKTPTKRVTLPSAGCTPFHITRNSQKQQSILNVTHSLEKPSRQSLLPEVTPRLTKVMFCSPVNTPTLVMQQKRKVIKSSMKGSNKSFVIDENALSNSVRPAARKRSFTHNDADDSQAKRKRLGDELQQSVDRLSRPRTISATGKPAQATPEKKAVTPNSNKPDRPVRTRLPNFAALHQKRFERMESLDECQERKARRARQLLTPTGSVSVLERSSPRGVTTEPPKPPKETKPPKEIPKPIATAKESSKKPTTKPLPTLETLASGYTRFGFKINIGVNPFVMSSCKPNSKEMQPKRMKQLTQPSLSGMTRREAAKETVTKERTRTSSGKRSVSRTIIKGVRTNRRFELQMKMRGDINSE